MNTLPAARPAAGRTIPVLMLTAFSVATGYGIALPRLPALLSAFPGAGGEAWRAQHLGGVTAAFFGAALVAAPLWGRLSDRLGRRRILALGALGFAVAFVATEYSLELWQLYLARVLDGAFSAAVAPAALAYLADWWPAGDARARRFAWLNASVLAGYLAGPLIGEAAARLGPLVPYAAPAAAAAAGALLTATLPRIRSPAGRQTAARSQLAARAWLLGVSAVAGGAVVAQEIAVAVPLGAGADGRAATALLLSFCGGVMFLTQVGIFSGRDAAARGVRLVRPLLLALAAILALSSFAQGFWLLALAVTGVASAAAGLTVLASYLTSRLDGPQGAGLGLQYAALSGGQLVGALGAGASAAAGVPAALWAAALLALALAATPRPRSGRDEAAGRAP